ncbi:MAG TPA: branched-chain amino acid ABC transporter substrate-binding protein, partial [Desulfobacteraceae bacterium]|nr:branched-chain amino acid ABC transporter substrate-binding protein [Desulfobacteraceae bacterium]
MNKEENFVKKTVLAMAIVACALMVSAYTYAESKEYRVGCLFDKTGSAAWLGEPQWGTAKMIEKEINDAGGINGHKLILEMEDSQGENNVAKEKVKKLISKKV